MAIVTKKGKYEKAAYFDRNKRMPLVCQNSSDISLEDNFAIGMSLKQNTFGSIMSQDSEGISGSLNYNSPVTYFFSFSCAEINKTPAVAGLCTDNVIRYFYYNGIATSWTSTTVSASKTGAKGFCLTEINGQPAFTYTIGTNLYYASTTNGVSWTETTVATDAISNVLTSVCEIGGYPTIVYASSIGLKYVFYDGLRWVSSTISSDSVNNLSFSEINGLPAVAYQVSTTMKYASYNGSSWDIQTVASGTVYSLVVINPCLREINRQPAMIYRKTATNTSVTYCRYNGSSWVEEAFLNTAFITNASLLQFNDYPIIVSVGGGFIYLDVNDGTNWYSRRMNYISSPTTYYDISACEIDGDITIVTSWSNTALVSFIVRYNDHCTLIDSNSSMLFPQGSCLIDSNPSVAYSSGSTLKYAHYNGVSWDVETVDVGESVSGNISIVNVYEQPGIVCGTSSGTTLKYAQYNGSSWDVTDIETISGILNTSVGLIYGTPAVAYITGTTLKYARFDGAVWNIESVRTGLSSGTYCSLYEVDGEPGIAYWFGSSLYYSHFNGTSWDHTTVTSPGTGTGVVLTVIDYRPTIIYTFGTNLNYVRYNGSSWATTVIDSSSDRQKFRPNYLKLDSGVMIVSYSAYDSGYTNVYEGKIAYLLSSTSNWVTRKLVENCYNITYNLTVQNDQPCLFFVDWGKLRYFYENPSFITSLITAVDTISTTSISVASVNDQPAIAYYKSDTKDLICSIYDGASWTKHTIDSSVDVGQYCSIKEVSGQPAIAYLDATSNVIKYTRWNGATWDTEGVDIGSGNCSLNIIDGQPAISYNRIKNVENKISASDPQTEDYFGRSVSISGDYSIVGAFGEDAGGSAAGAAYIYLRTDPNFLSSGVKIVASDAAAGDYFGYSVSISGDYAIVGAYGKNSLTGAAYIFHRTGTNTWDAGTKIVASDAAAGDYFGYSVSISGDYAIVGAQGQNTQIGAAYIFYRTGTNTWDAGTKIVSPDPVMYALFGISVSISGDYAIVGESNKQYGYAECGDAYIFHRTGTNTWDAGVRIVADDRAAYDHFGTSVSISGDYAVVGAPEKNGTYDNEGAIYIYHRTGTNTWDSGTKRVASDPNLNDYFGTSVSIDGNYIVVGAASKNSAAGAIYIFQGSGGVWSTATKITASDSSIQNYFGRSVSIDGEYVIVGADGRTTNTGQAYIYTSIWSGYGLKYARWNGASWDKELVVTSATIGVNTSLCEINGEPAISCDNYYYRYNGSTWVGLNHGITYTSLCEVQKQPFISGKITIGVGTYIVCYRYTGSTWEWDIITYFSGTLSQTTIRNFNNKPVILYKSYSAPTVIFYIAVFSGSRWYTYSVNSLASDYLGYSMDVIDGKLGIAYNYGVSYIDLSFNEDYDSHPIIKKEDAYQLIHNTPSPRQLIFSAYQSDGAKKDLNVTLPDKNWHYLLFVGDGTNVYAYVDNVLVDQVAYDGTVRQNTNPLKLGSTLCYTNFVIDNMGIWKGTTYDPSFIENFRDFLYNSSNTVRYEKIRAHWSETVETIDSTVVQMYHSITSIGGKAAVAYHDYNNKYLKYAIRNDDGTWTKEVVDGTIPSSSVGSYTSIVEYSSQPWISYYDITNGDLKCAHYNGASWVKETPDSGGAKSVGQYTCIRIINSYPAISYYNISDGDLKYVSYNGASWNTPETVDSSGNVGQYTSLCQVDGQPAISYYDVVNKDLKYARYNGATWDISTVDSTGDVGKYSSLGVIGTNPCIAYYDTTNKHPKYALWNGASWDITILDTSINETGEYTSLIVIGGYPIVVFYDRNNSCVRYLRYNGVSWIEDKFYSTASWGYYICIADVGSRPFIAFRAVTDTYYSYCYVPTEHIFEY